MGGVELRIQKPDTHLPTIKGIVGATPISVRLYCATYSFQGFRCINLLNFHNSVNQTPLSLVYS